MEPLVWVILSFYCSIYLLGRYINKYGNLSKIRIGKIGLVGLVFSVAIMVTTIVITYMIITGANRSYIVGPLWLYSNYNT